SSVCRSQTARAAQVRAASGRRHHAVVDTVGAVGRLEPCIAALVVGRAVDRGDDAAGRERRIDRTHGIRGIGCACGVAYRVGARGGGGGVGRGYGRASSQANRGPGSGSTGGGPAPAVAARGAVVVHRGRRVVRRIGSAVVGRRTRGGRVIRSRTIG